MSELTALGDLAAPAGLFIDGVVADREQRSHDRGGRPGDRGRDRPCPRRHRCRRGRRAGKRSPGVRDLAFSGGLGALSGAASDGRHRPRRRRPVRRCDDRRTEQAPGPIGRGGPLQRRPVRLVCRRGSADLWTHGGRPQPRHADHRASRADRTGRGVRRLELPVAAAGTQDRPRPGGRLLDHRGSPRRGTPELPVVRRGRTARRTARLRADDPHRRAATDLRAPDREPGDPQGVAHRLSAGGHPAQHDGGPNPEVGQHGTRRPRPAAGVPRCRHRCRRPRRRARQVPQRWSGVHLGEPVPGS